MGVGLGGFVGLCATAVIVLAARQWRIARLMGDNVRGVACSIGRLPINFERPVEAKELPNKMSLRLPPPEYDPKGKINRDWMDEWFKTYEGHHPEHAALMRAVARVLNSKPDLPAACNRLAEGAKPYHYGYDQHMHGDHTLLEHSWSCASVGIWLTKNGFEYDGVEFKDKYKDAVGFIGKKDDSYEFKDYDPLIGLICFAHDIGKIETFRLRADKTVEVIEPAHDSVGARMLTRMDEFWELPFEDRMTLTLAIGHYHKPSEMPLRRDAEAANKAVALSDRTMAMLNLVILSDEEAGAIENRKTEAEGKKKTKEIVENEYRANLWEAFKDLLNESQRVHTEPSKFRIGQKNTVGDAVIITLKEGDLRKELLDKMQLRKSEKEKQTASGASQITEDLLEVLDERGCLIKSFGGVTVDAKQAIWKVEFMGKDKTRLGDVIATWPYAIVINPEEHFPRLASGQDAQSLPRVTSIAEKSSMLEERKPRADAPKNVFTEGPLEDPNGGFRLAEGTKDKGRKKRQADHQDTRVTVEKSHAGNVVGIEAAGMTKDAALENEKCADGTQSCEAMGPAGRQFLDQGKREPSNETTHANGETGTTGSVGGVAEGGSQGSTVLSGLMDELDPLNAPGTQCGAKPAPVPVPVPVPVPGSRMTCDDQKTVGTTEQVEASNNARDGRDAPGQASNSKVALVQTLLKSHLQQDEVPQQAREEEKTKPVESKGEIPDDVMELARSLRQHLARIKVAVGAQKLAAEELKDGRQAYSLEALGTVVPELKAQLAGDPALLRRLMEAARLGKNVPVCVIHRSSSGVTLVVINEVEAGNALRRKKS